MRLRTIAFGVTALLVIAATPARADEAAEGRGLLAAGIIADIGSTASAIACGTLFTADIGHQLDNGGPSDGHTFDAIAVSCALNVGLGIAGAALTAVGAKKLEKGRSLQYSLNGMAVRF